MGAWARRRAARESEAVRQALAGGRSLTCMTIADAAGLSFVKATLVLARLQRDREVVVTREDRGPDIPARYFYRLRVDADDL